MTIHWYEGDLRPLRPAELEPCGHLSEVEDGKGMLRVGESGTSRAKLGDAGMRGGVSVDSNPVEECPYDFGVELQA